MEYTTVTQFAKRFGISRQFVWKMIKEGKLKAIKIGSIYKIPVSEVERIKKGKKIVRDIVSKWKKIENI